uniref:LOC100127754 protein n=1 Tax=Xenopus tropicalis TaxID=8364 RepID=A8WH24_XENTR
MREELSQRLGLSEARVQVPGDGGQTPECFLRYSCALFRTSRL